MKLDKLGRVLGQKKGITGGLREGFRFVTETLGRGPRLGARTFRRRRVRVGRARGRYRASSSAR